MKKVLKYGCLTIVALLAFILIVGAVFGSGDDNEEENKAAEVLSSVEWKDKTLEQKQETLNLMINYKTDLYSEHNFRLRQIVHQTISRMVKYPETLEYQSIFDNTEWVKYSSGSSKIINNSTTSIIDANNGDIQINVPFRSENKLGQKVRNNLVFKLNYQGKPNFKILDVKTN